MLAKHGEPKLADLNFRIESGRMGSNSPMTVEELGKLTFEQAVERVSSWKPDEQRRFQEPNIKGLASTFGQYVATDPIAFSAQAEALIWRPATFVRTFIQQMAEAAKAGTEINVSSVLKLCRWVIERPIEERTTAEQGDWLFVDKNWQWTRDAISQFIQNVCEAMVDDAPKYPLDELRDLLWWLINVLCQDQVESGIVDNAEHDPRVIDYYIKGINSSRGRAVEAAFEYARWVANHIKNTEGSQEVIEGGFDAMPEVREMLEWQISPGNRCFEVLAMIGSRMGLIYWLDKAWLSDNAEQLFRLEDIEKSPQKASGWAAWNAFLVWVLPRVEFYRLFKKQFDYAVKQSAKVNPTEKTREQPMYHLGEHLMILYGLGHLRLDEDDGLLRRFLAESQPDIRRQAISSVGESVAGEEKISEAIVNRFKALWDVYWEGSGKKDAAEEPGAWLFGTWFSSGQFPDQWAIDQLEKFVSVNPTPEPNHSIMEQLAKISKVDIVKSVRILDLMVHGDREGWRIYGWRDSAMQILGVALKAGGDARKQAEQIINYLGRRGYTMFGELLNLSGGDTR